MNQSVVANPYSGEHRVRSDLAATLAESDYHIKRYSLSDNGDERTLTLVAIRSLTGTQTHLNFNLDPSSHPDHV